MSTKNTQPSSLSSPKGESIISETNVQRIQVAPAPSDSILNMTFLKLAVHAQQHRTDFILITNNGVWVILAAGGDMIEKVTRTITPIVEKWHYNELDVREFNLVDRLDMACEWMAERKQECFHVIMQLPVVMRSIGQDDREEEIDVMYAMGIRGETEIRNALKHTKLLK